MLITFLSDKNRDKQSQDALCTSTLLCGTILKAWYSVPLEYRFVSTYGEKNGVIS